MLKTRYLIAALLGSTAIASAAYAATQTVTANIKFDTPLTITKNSDINFGYVKAATAGKYVVNTAGTVTASNGGVSLGGTTQAGSLTISGSPTQAIDISAGNYVANNGVTPSAATCAYNGGPASACLLNSQPAPGAGKTLLLGVTAAVNGTQAAGTSAAPSFDVVVNYH
ncbi:MAG: DUF4402 domain-containing protein [Bdellovibrionales bacterium]